MHAKHFGHPPDKFFKQVDIQKWSSLFSAAFVTCSTYKILGKLRTASNEATKWHTYQNINMQGFGCYLATFIEHRKIYTCQPWPQPCLLRNERKSNSLFLRLISRHPNHMRSSPRNIKLIGRRGRRETDNKKTNFTEKTLRARTQEDNY